MGNRSVIIGSAALEMDGRENGTTLVNVLMPLIVVLNMDLKAKHTFYVSDHNNTVTILMN